MSVNGLIQSISRFWKYHFVIRNGDIEVWVEKYSGCFDTGHRFSFSMFQNKDLKRYFQRVIEEFER